MFFGSPLATALTPEQPFIGLLGVFNLAFLLGIPILSLALLAGRLVSTTKYNVKWKRSLTLLWALNIFSLFGIGSYIANQFSVNKTINSTNQELSSTEDVWTLRASENPYADSWLSIGNLDIAGDVIASRSVQIQIEKSENDLFQLQVDKRSRGKNLAAATTSATQLQHRLTLENNEIIFDPYFALQEGEKWRNQSITIRLFIPEGKSIQFEDLPWHIRRNIQSENHNSWYNMQNGEVWTMTETGFEQ